MRTISILLILLISLKAFDLHAQQKKSTPPHHGQHCPVSLEPNETDHYMNLIRGENNISREVLDGTYNLPVQFHLLRTSAGTGGITAEEAAWELEQANLKFVWLEVEFFQCSPVHFIDDDNFFFTEFQFDWEDFCGQTNAEYTIANQNNVDNVINIYYVNTDGWNWAPLPAALPLYCKDWLIMDIDDIGNDYLLAHELGHYFNLLHTHEDYDDNDPDNNEHITRSPGDDCYNCFEAGDYLCDTPADNEQWNNCNWDGSGSDGCSNLDFEPEDMNIMSYSGCQWNFTSGQHFRMTLCITTSRAYLDCPFLSDCNSTQTLEQTQNNTYAFQASNYITSTATINPGALSMYDAGNYVRLLPGFHAKAGSVFQAFVDGCWGPVIFKENE